MLEQRWITIYLVLKKNRQKSLISGNQKILYNRLTVGFNRDFEDYLIKLYDDYNSRLLTPIRALTSIFRVFARAYQRVNVSLEFEYGLIHNPVGLVSSSFVIYH